MEAEAIVALLSAGKKAAAKPKDPGVLLAYASALADADRLGDAMVVAKHAASIGGGTRAAVEALEIALDVARATQDLALSAAEACAVRARREGARGELGIGVERSLAEISVELGRLEDGIAILSTAIASTPEPEGDERHADEDEDDDDGPITPGKARRWADERLEEWRSDEDIALRARARAAGLRGDHAEVIRSYDAIGRGATEDDVDIMFRVDAHVAIGEADLALLAWAQDADLATEPVALLAGARAILASGSPLEDALELVHQVALAEGARRHAEDVEDTLALAGERPLAEWEAVVTKLHDMGAVTLADRVATDAFEHVAGAAKSKVLRKRSAKPASSPRPDDVAAILRAAEEEAKAFAALARGDAKRAAPFLAHAAAHTRAGYLAAAWSTAAEKTLSPDDALDVHWTTRRAAPLEVEPAVNLALHLFRRGLRDAAVDAVIAALDNADPDDFEAIVKRLAPAWKKAKVPFPLDVDDAYQAGEKAYHAKKFELAARCYAFCRVWAGDDESASDETRAYVGLGDVRRAVWAACRLHGDGGPLIAADLLNVEGKSEASVWAGRWGVRAYPCRRGFDQLACTAYVLGDFHVAASAWRKAAAPEWSSEPFESGNTLCFGWALLRIGDVAGAAAWAKRATDELTEKGDVAWAAELSAAVCMAKKDWPKALELAKRAVAVHGKDAKETLDRVKKKEPYPLTPAPKGKKPGRAWTRGEARRRRVNEAVAAAAAELGGHATKAMIPAPVPEPVGAEIATGGFRASELDARGLVPLARARKIVRSGREFRKGAGTMIDGSFVLESDVLWAALLSLEDASEFVREARRIAWYFHPRGHDNVWLVKRYGDGILPWLADHVDEDGVLHDVPWCVRPCLLAIGTEEAGEIVLRIRARSAAERFDMRGPGAADDPGDVDRRPPPIEKDEGDKIAREWIAAHPDVAFRLLAKKTDAGDARAAELLQAHAPARPGGAFACAKVALGEARASKLFERSKLPKALTEEAILNVLDGYAEGRAETTFSAWPLFNTDVDGRNEYHGLRLVAARARPGDGDGWGIVIERITGCYQNIFGVEVYCYGSDVDGGMNFDAGRSLDIDFGDPPDEEWPDDFGLDLDLKAIWGAGGPLLVGPGLLESCDLRPGATTEDDSNASSSLMLRAYLAIYPHAFWTAPAEAVKVLGLGDDPEIVVVSTAFEHVLGTNGGSNESDHDAKWCKPPSRSKTYQSLAAALVARDKTRFVPGTSNLDWRLHAIFGGKKKKKGKRS